jgi:hypothetical protein
METILNLLCAAGAIGSTAFLAWGMVLCTTHAFGLGDPASDRARWARQDLPAGTFF